MRPADVLSIIVDKPKEGDKVFSAVCVIVNFFVGVERRRNEEKKGILL